MCSKQTMIKAIYLPLQHLFLFFNFCKMTSNSLCVNGPSKLNSSHHIFGILIKLAADFHEHTINNMLKATKEYNLALSIQRIAYKLVFRMNSSMMFWQWIILNWTFSNWEWMKLSFFCTFSVSYFSNKTEITIAYF